MPGAQELYDQDFYLWTRETAAALRARRFVEIDVEHLAEEIEDMAGETRANWKAGSHGSWSTCSNCGWPRG